MPKIENISIGICQSRAQQGKPSFFVNWTESGENKYEFFSMVYPMYQLKERLEKQRNPKPVTPSSGLIEMIQQVPEDGFPFTTTIVEENERFKFT